MFIQEIPKKANGKTYYSTLLLRSYRSGDKVRHETVANLTSWPREIVEEFKLLLKGGKVTCIDDLPHKQGKTCGGLIVISEICKRLGISKALGKSSEAMLSILLIVGRIIIQKSRLYLSSQWSLDEAIEEVLGIKRFNEDDLYKTLDWLSDNQELIENSIFQHQVGKPVVNEICLYDVTSSYLEGDENELAEYGYNRDKKKGKKQIIIGLMTDKEGWPISIEVFKGNTSDNKTVISQLRKLQKRFGFERVIFVGDRGMIKSAQIKDIEEEFKFNFITAITKSQINKMLEDDIIQLGLFDDEVCEIEHGGYRYILKRNPYRADEVALSRLSRIEYVIKKLTEKNERLKTHKKASINIAIRDMQKLIKNRKLTGILNVSVDEGLLKYEFDEEKLKEDSRLDGCYVLKTDVGNEIAEKELIHERYKDLEKVEKAFRTIKTGLEEIRPIYVRKESRTRGHVFVCMLAYMVVKYIWDRLKDSGYELSFIFETLEKIQYIIYEFKGKEIKVLPSEYKPHQEKILQALQIQLPHNL